jgi:hypothetical protein
MWRRRQGRRGAGADQAMAVSSPQLVPLLDLHGLGECLVVTFSSTCSVGLDFSVGGGGHIVSNKSI